MLRALIITYIFLLFSCNQNGNSDEKRPLEAWVFRSVLDRNPRILTVALHQNLFVAYHTKTGGLYKAWKGNVMFDGPVYTTAHGPQPISIGDAYMVNKHISPWFLQNDKGDTISSVFNYKGHRFDKGQVELMFELSYDKSEKPLQVFEKVECIASDNGQVSFQRKYTTKGVPSGMKVVQKLNLSSIVSEKQIKTNGKLSTVSSESKSNEDIQYLEWDGALELVSNGETECTVQFLANPMIPNENNVLVESEEEREETASEGLTLIGKSDCKTCHNKTLKTIGPSYTDIAK